MAQGVRADPHPEPLERFGRLLGPRSSRRDGVQDADHRGVAGERQQLHGGGDGFEVEDLRPARNDDQVVDLRGLEGGRFRPHSWQRIFTNIHPPS